MTNMHAATWRFRDMIFYGCAAFMATLLFVILLQFLRPYIQPIAPFALAPILQITLYGAMLLPLWYLIHRKRGTHHEVKIPHQWPGFKLAIVYPIFAWITLFILLTALVGLAGGELPGVTGEKTSVASIPQDPFSTFLLISVAGIIAPVAEEVLFRGALLPALLQRYSPWLAISCSALLFAFAHTQQLGSALILFLLGLLAGALAWRSNSILPAIIFHMLNNTIALLVDYLGGGLM